MWSPSETVSRLVAARSWLCATSPHLTGSSASAMRSCGRRLSAWTLQCCVAVLLAIGASTTVAQEMALPPETQVSLLTRVLPFDRQFRARVGDELVIGVIYQRRYRESLNASSAVEEALNGHTRIDGLPVRVVRIELTDVALLSESIETSDIDVLYVAPLRAQSLARITAITRTLRVLTFTGVPTYVDDGVAVGVTIRGQRPQILINLEAATAEGAHFSSELLKLARIVEP